MQALPNRNNDIESVSLLLCGNSLLMIYPVCFFLLLFSFSLCLGGGGGGGRAKKTGKEDKKDRASREGRFLIGIFACVQSRVSDQQQQPQCDACECVATLFHLKLVAGDISKPRWIKHKTSTRLDNTRDIAILTFYIFPCDCRNVNNCPSVIPKPEHTHLTT